MKKKIYEYYNILSTITIFGLLLKLWLYFHPVTQAVQYTIDLITFFAAILVIYGSSNKESKERD